MARMERPRYVVWTRGADTEEETPTTLEVQWADQLRGELEAGKHGIDTAAPMNLATVWVWCAMARTGGTALRFPEWRETELVGIEKAPPAVVDPTVAAPPAASP